MSDKKEEAYVLVGVLLLLAAISILSLYFTYFIQREYEIMQAQEDKIREKFIITGLKRVMRNEVEKKAAEELKSNSLTKQDLNKFKEQINYYDNKIDLADEQFRYRLKEVFDLNARVNLNQVKQEELKLLPGIGETLSERIVVNRKYKQLDELKRLNGLGETTFNDIKDLITLQGKQKININTANYVAWKLINQRLDFKLSDYIFSNQQYSDFEELLARIDEEEKRKRLKAKGQQLIKFNSNLIAIRYEMLDLKSEDKFSGELVISY